MNKRWAWLGVGAAALVVAVVLVLTLPRKGDDVVPSSVTVGERLDALKAKRAELQARADGRARVELLQALRVASLLCDALAVRAEMSSERAVDRLPQAWRDALTALDGLNMALGDALARPGAGATLAAHGAAQRAEAALDKLADGNELPLLLSFTPRFVPPRRMTGELTIAPPAAPPPRNGSVRLGAPSVRPDETSQPAVPVYAPSFATSPDEDPPVAVEIAGLGLGRKRASALLTVGAWRGEGEVSPERLRFSVPRSAFATAAVRTTLVTATLAVRREGRTLTFELPFVVLPDRPGSVALDQRVRSTILDSKTLVSPQILARAGVGETNTVHRCFDPPPGWRFDKAQSRVVVVERLAWVDDVSDDTMNAGTVEMAQGKPEQLCVDVVARPAAKTARTATIGRFEATLVRDKEEDQVVHTGVRALDWRERLSLPLESGSVEWKLYIRLFDEIDRDFDGKVTDLPFLHVAIEEGKDGGKTLVLTADPKADLGQ